MALKSSTDRSCCGQISSAPPPSHLLPVFRRNHQIFNVHLLFLSL